MNRLPQDAIEGKKNPHKSAGYQRDSAAEKIHSCLTSKLGQWVSARELSNLAIEYKRPIWELRHRDGVTIENQSVWVNGRRHGYYRIPAYPGQPAPELPEKSDRVERPIPQSTTKPEAAQEPAQLTLGIAPSHASRFVEFECGLKTAESR